MLLPIFMLALLAIESAEPSPSLIPDSMALAVGEDAMSPPACCACDCMSGSLHLQVLYLGPSTVPPQRWH